eukprot:Rmarinus@m.815
MHLRKFHYVILLTFFFHISSVISLCPSLSLLGMDGITGVTSPFLQIQTDRPISIRIMYNYSFTNTIFETNVPADQLTQLPQVSINEDHSDFLQLSVSVVDPATSEPVSCEGKIIPHLSHVVHVFPIHCITFYSSGRSCVDPGMPETPDPWPMSPWTPKITYVYSVAMHDAFSPPGLEEPVRFRRWLSRIAFQEGAIPADVILVLDGNHQQHKNILDIIPVMYSPNSRSLRIVESPVEDRVLNPFFVGAAMSNAPVIAAPLLRDLGGRDYSARLGSFFIENPTQGCLVEEIDGGVRLVAMLTPPLSAAKSLKLPSRLRSEPEFDVYAHKAYLYGLPQHLPLSDVLMPDGETSSDSETSSDGGGDPAKNVTSAPPPHPLLHDRDYGRFFASFLEMLEPRFKNTNMGFAFVDQLKLSRQLFSEPLYCSFQWDGLPESFSLPVSSSAAGWMMPCCLLSGQPETNDALLTVFTANNLTIPAAVALTAEEFVQISMGYCDHKVLFSLDNDFEELFRDPGPGVSVSCAMLRVLFQNPYNEEALWMLSSRPLGTAIATASLSGMSASSHQPLDRRHPAVISHIARAGFLNIHIGGSTCARDGMNLIFAALAMAADEEGPGQSPSCVHPTSAVSSVTAEHTCDPTAEELSGVSERKPAASLSLETVRAWYAENPRLREWPTLGLLSQDLVAFGPARLDSEGSQHGAAGDKGQTGGAEGGSKAEKLRLDLVQDALEKGSRWEGVMDKYAPSKPTSSLWNPWSVPVTLSPISRSTPQPSVWPARYWGLLGPGEWVRVPQPVERGSPFVDKSQRSGGEDALEWEWHSHLLKEKARFHPEHLWEALPEGSPAWIHFSGDSRARFTMFQLFADLSESGWAAEEVQAGNMGSRFANHHLSGCWSRVCADGGAEGLNVSLGECLYLAHASRSPINFARDAHKLYQGREIDSLLYRYVALNPTFQEYTCQYTLSKGSRSVRITFDFRKSFQVASSIDFDYDARTFSSPHFRPDVLVVGPTHDAAYWGDALYHHSGDVHPDDVAVRIVENTKGFLDRLATWHCGVSPSTKIIVLDDSVIFDATPVKHEPSTLGLASLISDIITEKATVTTCHRDLLGASAFDSLDGTPKPWYLPLPTHRMTLAAFLRGSHREIAHDGLHWNQRVVGQFIHAYITRALQLQ